MNHGKEFRKYAVNHLGLAGTTVDAVNNHMVKSSMTPYILEEREMRVTQMDVFSRLMMERIIWITGSIADNMASVIQAQLMFMDSISSNDITIQGSSGGGSILAGLGIIDCMQYVKSEITTINMGMAASMMCVIMAAGNKRLSLPSSRFMIHQASSGFEGELRSLQISLRETEKYNDKLFSMLGEFCNKDPEIIKKDAERDFWLSASEAIDYGLLSEIVKSKKEKKETKKKK
jgi:ATP-dependent Clp protease protease subunit